MAAILATMLATAGLCASKSDTADSPKELAMAMAKKAKRAQKAGHNAEAYLLYSQAAAIDPKNRSYHARMELLQTRATKESKPQPLPGSESGLPPAELSPDDVFDSLTEKEMAARAPAQPGAFPQRETRQTGFRPHRRSPRALR